MLGSDQAPFVCPREHRLGNFRVSADSEERCAERSAECALDSGAGAAAEPEEDAARRDGALVTASGSVGAGEERGRVGCAWGGGTYVAARILNTKV